MGRVFNGRNSSCNLQTNNSRSLLSYYFFVIKFHQTHFFLNFLKVRELVNSIGRFAQLQPFQVLFFGRLLNIKHSKKRLSSRFLDNFDKLLQSLERRSLEFGELKVFARRVGNSNVSDALLVGLVDGYEREDIVARKSNRVAETYKESSEVLTEQKAGRFGSRKQPEEPLSLEEILQSEEEFERVVFKRANPL